MIKSIFYLITCILTIKERKLILEEISQSPYVNIDESLTEALYKNIIEQSKNPENKDLKEIYNRLTENNRFNESGKINNAVNNSVSNITNIQSDNDLSNNNLFNF